MIPIDGDGDQWQEAAGDEDDPETLEAEQAERGRRVSEKFPKNLPVDIYSLTLSV